MEKFNKDKNKIKSLRIRKGIPFFINFCYNQKIRNNLANSKLFVDVDGLHYHEKHSTGGESLTRIDSSVQYIIKKVENYIVDSNKIRIDGVIEVIKDGNKNTKKVINTFSLYRIYSNENKLIEYLEKHKNIK